MEDRTSKKILLSLLALLVAVCIACSLMLIAAAGYLIFR